MNSNEQRLIRAFIIKGKQERYESLLASIKRRSKILKQLDHLHDLEEKKSFPIASNEDVYEILVKNGAPKNCHIISADLDLDQQVMLLRDAVDEVEASCSGTLIGCIPGKLAYYYGESGEQRILLKNGT